MHRGSFYLWLLALVTQVAAHSKNVVHLAGEGHRTTHTDAHGGARYRLLTLTGSLLLGSALALGSHAVQRPTSTSTRTSDTTNLGPARAF